MACISLAVSFPAPGNSRSITYLGISCVPRRTGVCRGFFAVFGRCSVKHGNQRCLSCPLMIHYPSVQLRRTPEVRGRDLLKAALLIGRTGLSSDPTCNGKEEKKKGRGDLRGTQESDLTTSLAFREIKVRSRAVLPG